MAIFGAGKYASKFRYYLGYIFYGHVIISLIITVLLGIGAVFAYHFESEILAVALVGMAIAAPFVLSRWLTRRPFYVLSRPHWSAASSLAYLVLVGPALFVLHDAQLLSPLSAMLAMAVAALLASVWATAYLLRPKWNLKDAGISARDVLHDHWAYGRWSSATRIVAWIGNNIYFIVLPVIVGFSGSGALRALTNFVMPIMMVKASLTAILVPSFVRSYTIQGPAKLRGRVNGIVAFSIIVSSAYYLILVIFGRPVAHLLYAGQYDQYVTLPLLIVMGLVPVFSIVNGIIDAVLRSMGEVRLTFRAEIPPFVFTITLGTVLLLWFDVLGAAIGLLITEIITFVNLMYYYRRHRTVTPEYVPPNV